MSGPKVINIEAIRRQQQRLCDRQLRQLRNAILAWQNCLKRTGKLDEAADAEAVTQLKRLEAMRESDLAVALRELPSLIQFFQAEEASARNAMVERARSLRDRRRRIEQSAAMLTRELNDLEEMVPGELREAVERAGEANDNELARLEASVQRAFAEAARVRDVRRGAERDQRLAKFAAEFGTAAQSPEGLGDWLAAKGGRTGKEREKEGRLAMLLAEVEAWDDEEGVAPFIHRAREIAAEPRSDRRELLTDSLILNVAEHRTNQRRRTALSDRLREALALLEPYQSAEADSLRKRLELELTSTALLTADSLAAEAETWCATAAKREDAKLRREAVLRALCELGYEVREGMAVAWAEDGRIVLSKPSETNYGVELMSPAEATTLQARVVAFDRPGRGQSDRDRLRDKEVEESWCSDLTQMQSQMKQAGFDAAIRRATKAGVVDVKVVARNATMSSAASPETALTARTK